MYRRFLNDNDYLSIITSKSLNDITRGDTSKFAQAESDAEMAVIEYLSENYEIEKELSRGKYIAEYSRQITFPIGAYIYFGGKLCRVIRSISGFKAPSDTEHWQEHYDINLDIESVQAYSQFGTYYVGDLVQYNGRIYICLAENGYDFNDIRIPLLNGWKPALSSEWQPVQYSLWSVVKYNGLFFTLINLDGFDNNHNPLDSDCWGVIADYDSEIDSYELSDHEYVVYNDAVYYPEMDVNADVPVLGVNIAPDDPRNQNIKKHMVRLAIYELTKLIAPNNVSTIRIADYEASMKWLSDASKLKINPQIPRKLDENKEVVTDWQMATFQTEFDPYKNMWLL